MTRLYPESITMSLRDMMLAFPKGKLERPIACFGNTDNAYVVHSIEDVAAHNRFFTRKVHCVGLHTDKPQRIFTDDDRTVAVIGTLTMQKAPNAASHQ